MKSNEGGFTLAELLIVIAVIGIVSGVAITVIDPFRQRDVALDASKRQNLSDVANAIETFRVTEGKYPAQGSNNNPLDSSAIDSSALKEYVELWPAFLEYSVDSENDVFSLHTEKETEEDMYFKYNSDWKKIQECNDISGVDACIN